ncbi:MAG: AAA family ATPase [Clostridiaceae bacterium]|nr:AAA family ATPase [Clostridiaceae bacterium]
MEEKSYKDRLTRIYKFLKEYNSIKNPVLINIKEQLWSQWLGEIPVHETIKCFIFSNEEEEDFVLSVKRPVLTEAPKPPKVAVEWIKPGWNNARSRVEVVEEKTIKNDKYNDKENNGADKYLIIRFSDELERVEAYEEWIEKRNEWAKKEIPTQKAMEVFNSIYALYSRIQKEAEGVELMLGDGLLYWNEGNSSMAIEHPILLQTVKLDFDANVPEFKVSCTEKMPELYSALFYSIPDINIQLLKENINDLEKNNYSPMWNENTSAFLKRVTVMLCSQGTLIEEKIEIKRNETFPQVYRKPVLFLRKRTLGYNVAIDSILEDMQGNDQIPNFLKDVVGCLEEPGSTRSQEGTSSINPNGIDEEILLTKPANAEQLTVAKQLEQYGAVLVQGPPGTGKTHTIANLIGHLLAQGKSILVTSHSEKALSVVKEKVVEELQPLCLSLLSSTESRAEMEKTLDIINENRSKLDINKLLKEINILQSDRSHIINELDNFRLQLKNVRSNEYRPLIIAGEEYSPIEAAKFIKDNELKSNWIPEPIAIGKSIPLTLNELKELYKTNGELTVKDEQECKLKLPEISELITPLEFKRVIEEKENLRKLNIDFNKEFWRENKIDYAENILEGLINKIDNALGCLDENQEWTLATIEAGTKEEVIKKQWHNLVEEINKTYDISINSSEEIIQFDPKFIKNPLDPNVSKTLEEIIEKLQVDKKIGSLSLFLNPNWKKLIKASLVNNQEPKKLEEFKALKAYQQLLLGRETLQSRWDRQIAILGAPKVIELGIDFEKTCKKYCEPIEINLNWFKEIWSPIIKQLKEIGFLWDRFDKRIDLSTEKYSQLKYIKSEQGNLLIKTIEAEINRVSYNKLINNLEKVANFAGRYSNNQKDNVIFNIINAVEEDNLQMYTLAYERLIEVNTLMPIQENRNMLLEKLKVKAPGWAEIIESRTGIHGRANLPETVQEAWLWTQFNSELKERSEVSLEKIQGQILKLENELMDNTSKLAFKKAWKAKLILFDNNKSQVQAIEGWRQIIRKIGAGKGKRADSLKAEARKLMPLCQAAVPVWIMPLNKVVENFDPKQNKFDVVIIDEASQADVMSFIALYLGKRVLIVGDNEQVSPLAIGQKVSDIEKLINEYLFDIPNHILYTGQFSIYDLAQTAGYQPVRLKEHFRCVPEIIQYSNILSYNGQIKPLRDSSQVKTRPFTIAYRVENAISKNKVNNQEAETITSLIIACVEQPEYLGKTIGVITLRGEKQAALIDNLLQSKMEPVEYNKRHILCGNSANFQGDERDIIFLSMVDTNETEGPLRLNGYGNDNLYKKRYNVAVSRARDQLWLIHSLDVNNDLKPGDIRKELLEYVQNLNTKENLFKLANQKSESEFETRVMKSLINKGFKVVPQWEVGAYRIDMVVEGNGKRIALECDGERWHNSSNLEEDMIRQAILERLGWRFIRIRGSEFFRDPETTMNMVFEKLESMEITTTGLETSEKEDDNELKGRIVGRAEEIRAQW